MDSKELKKILKRERISKDLYSLKGGLPNESYCLEKMQINGRYIIANVALDLI